MMANNKSTFVVIIFIALFLLGGYFLVVEQSVLGDFEGNQINIGYIQVPTLEQRVKDTTLYRFTPTQPIKFKQYVFQTSGYSQRYDTFGGGWGNGAGYKWTLTNNGNIITKQTDLTLDNIYYDTIDKSYVSVKDGVPLLLGDYDYKIQQTSYGGRDRQDNYKLRISLYKYLDMDKINFSINLEDSYIKNDSVNLELTVCNNLNQEFLGVFNVEYGFSTFLGSVKTQVGQRINIRKGCNSYPIPFSTEDLIKNLTIEASLKIYEKGYGGILVDKNNVLEKENSDLNPVLVRENDYIFISNVNFEGKKVNIINNELTDEEPKTLNIQLIIIILLVIVILAIAVFGYLAKKK